jgi:hypothetical protein
MATPRYASYGYVKAGLVQLKASLLKENKKSSFPGKVSIHNLSPGMVITDLLMGDSVEKAQANGRQALGKESSSFWIFNILAERACDVAAWLVPRTRACYLESKAPGQEILFLTPAGVVWRFVTAFMRRNRLFTIDNLRGIATDNQTGETYRVTGGKSKTN